MAQKLGIDLIWFGVLLGANMQTSFMHPPFGFALFYLRSVAPAEDYTDRVTKMPIKKVTIEQIYVPTKYRKSLDQKKVDKLAGDILENGLKIPIHVRPDADRYILVEGLHRLEAARALGEATIDSLIVHAHRA